MAVKSSRAVFEVLREISKAGTALGAADVAKILSLPITTAARALSTLEAAGFVVRQNGAAKFTLSAVMREVSGAPLFGRIVYLQTSTDGKTWKKTYKLVTSNTGKVSRRFSVRSKQTTYYRWYVPAIKGVVNKTYSASIKVRVK